MSIFTATNMSITNHNALYDLCCTHLFYSQQHFIGMSRHTKVPATSRYEVAYDGKEESQLDATITVY
jgi:hypothetical protein